MKFKTTYNIVCIAFFSSLWKVIPSDVKKIEDMPGKCRIKESFLEGKKWKLWRIKSLALIKKIIAILYLEKKNKGVNVT